MQKYIRHVKACDAANEFKWEVSLEVSVINEGEFRLLTSTAVSNKLLLQSNLKNANIHDDNSKDVMYVLSVGCTYRVPSEGSWAPSRDYGS